MPKKKPLMPRFSDQSSSHPKNNVLSGSVWDFSCIKLKRTKQTKKIESYDFDKLFTKNWLLGPPIQNRWTKNLDVLFRDENPECMRFHMTCFWVLETVKRLFNNHTDNKKYEKIHFLLMYAKDINPDDRYHPRLFVNTELPLIVCKTMYRYSFNV